MALSCTTPSCTYCVTILVNSPLYSQSTEHLEPADWWNTAAHRVFQSCLRELDDMFWNTSYVLYIVQWKTKYATINTTEIHSRFLLVTAALSRADRGGVWQSCPKIAFPLKCSN